MPHLEYTRLIDAPRSLVWDVISDHELYGDVAPNLASVEVIDGAEDTMVRRCVDTDGNAWTEACTDWIEGEGFAVEVDVANSGFHRNLFDRFQGRWGVTATPEGPEVSIRFDYDTKYGPLGRLISAYLAYKAPGLIEAIFDRWETEIESRTERFAAEQPATAGGQPNALHP